MVEKTALVLSAGGMFGAYQAGAWRELALRIRPDMVIGTSVGALNGWAIAGGCPPEELIGQWRDPAAAGFLSLRIPRFPWRGFFAGGPFRARIQQLCSLYSPRIPLGVVLTDLVRLRSRLVVGPQVTLEHLAAACAIPVGFPPVRVDGRLYVDGGVMGVLPLWAAAEMGATRVIAVNALPVMPSRIIRGMIRMVRWMSPERRTAGGLNVVVVAPKKPIGSLRDSVRWDRGRIEHWIELGARDARSITISLLCPSTESIA